MPDRIKAFAKWMNVNYNNVTLTVIYIHILQIHELLLLYSLKSVWIGVSAKISKCKCNDDAALARSTGLWSGNYLVAFY